MWQEGMVGRKVKITRDGAWRCFPDCGARSQTPAYICPSYTQREELSQKKMARETAVGWAADQKLCVDGHGARH